MYPDTEYNVNELVSEIVELKKYKKLTKDIENWLDSKDKIYSKSSVVQAIQTLKISNNIK